MLACENPFWHFSLAIYATPEVAAECLALQNTLAIDVNALLFCAWLGNAYKAELSDEALAAIDEHVEIWRDTVVRPLRTIRQDIKPMPAMVDDAVKELRGDIARIELRAEQIEQAMLFDLTPGLVAGATATTSADAVAHNVTAFIERHLKRHLQLPLGHRLPAQGPTDTVPPKAPHLTAAATAYNHA